VHAAVDDVRGLQVFLGDLVVAGTRSGPTSVRIMPGAS
jgi:hypothetical protein